jgi:hypothetical protein
MEEESLETLKRDAEGRWGPSGESGIFASLPLSVVTSGPALALRKQILSA